MAVIFNYPFDYSVSCTFLACSERASRGAPLPFVFLPSPQIKADGHHQHFDEVIAALDDGSLMPTFQSTPPSIVLKSYFKNKSTIPTLDGEKKLALELLGSPDKHLLIRQWFEQKRLALFLKAEEKNHFMLMQCLVN